MTNVLMIESCVHAYIWLPLPGCMEVDWKTAQCTQEPGNCMIDMQYMYIERTNSC